MANWFKNNGFNTRIQNPHKRSIPHGTTLTGLLYLPIIAHSVFSMIKIVSEYLHFILPIEFKDLLKILVQDLINDSMMIDQHIIFIYC